MSFLVTLVAAIAIVIVIFLAGIIGTWLIEHFFGLGELLGNSLLRNNGKTHGKLLM